VGKFTLAVAVEVAKVPVEAKLLTLVATPNCGNSLTVKTVPTGVLVVVSVTETGLVVPDGNDTSAVA